MAYSKQNWENLPARTTPLSAARLSHMETQYDQAMSEAVPRLRVANRVYGTQASGSVTGIPVSKAVSPESIVQRSGSQINVPINPTESAHAASKAYVDAGSGGGGETAVVWIIAPPPSGSDDSAALTSVADAAAASGLGLRLRAGETYLVRPGGVRLTGAHRRYIDGAGATIKIAGTTVGAGSFPALNVTDATSVTIADLHIDGSDDTFGSADWTNYRYGMHVSDSDRVRIENVTVDNYSSVGIRVTRCVDASIQRAKVTDGQFHGIAVEQSQRVEVRNNVFLGRGNQGSDPSVGGCGILLLRNDVVVAEGNYIRESSDSGLKAEACNDIVYRGNWVVDAGKDAIKAGAYSASFTTASRVLIEGNIALRINAWRADGSSLLQVYDGDVVTIRGNTLVGGGNRVHPTEGVRDEDGIRVFKIYSTGSEKVLVEGNNISDVATAGVTIGVGSKSVTVRGNKSSGWINVDEVPAGGTTVISGNDLDRPVREETMYAIRVRGVAGNVLIQDNTASRFYGFYLITPADAATIEAIRIIGNTATSMHRWGGQISKWSGALATIRFIDLSQNVFINVVEGANGWGYRINGNNLAVNFAAFTGNRVMNYTANTMSSAISIRGSANSVELLELDGNINLGAIGTPFDGKNLVPRILGWSDTGAPTWGTWVTGDRVQNSNAIEEGVTPNKYIVEGWVRTATEWLERRVFTGR